MKCQTGFASFDQEEKNYGGRRTLPYAFTEQGISMLASVLYSEVAVKVSFGITLIEDVGVVRNILLRLELEIEG